MDRKFDAQLADLAQTHPALGLLRLAALLAEAEAEPDDDALDLLFEQVDAGFLLDVAPAEIWPELARGLMARSPAKMIRTLRDCGALAQVLPEAEALFGVPQLADEPAPVDLGAHLLDSLHEAALCAAPLPVRVALLLMNVGKADSPREHLPLHYRHIERGLPRIDAICARLGAPQDCRELALAAAAEHERVHRASKARAGPIALMLERLGGFDAPQRFRELMTVCACDYRAYGERSGQNYPKAELLETALAACAEIDGGGFAGTNGEDELREARALAIARVFGSQRWSG
ncbi:tRNA nucleotidyltransferase [uncultured Rhodoblastus sp.]|uniref:tRNA nucleotidyltransferase n=1 Tax=uncultured Rhodoblastus sp. TaxID=543037 RepID=UPI0025DB1FD5|nr:tRNA nucleotidyltransferase [uncultured Rhodoblastus sp.]